MSLFHKKDSHSFLAKFNEEKGNYAASFEQSHYKDIQKWEKKITASRQKSNCKDVDKRLKALYDSKELIEDFAKWCSKYKYGDEYAQKTYNGMYQRVLKEIETLEK